MKKSIILLVAVALILFSCKNEKSKKNEKETEKQEINYISFGEKIDSKNAISKLAMVGVYKNLKEGDTINVKFSSSINEVCKKKGCWMKLDLGEEEESFVNFKEYGFFMPLNSDGREVIVNGKAFLKITTVEELRHFAKDAGDSEEEIEKIVESKRTLAFEADGVLMVE